MLRCCTEKRPARGLEVFDDANIVTPARTRQQETTMASQDLPDPQFDAMTARMLRREALRRAAEELNTTSPPGLENVLARISAEVTADAAGRVAATPHGASTIAKARPPAAPSNRGSGGSQP
jgi:hypothetical protein